MYKSASPRIREILKMSPGTVLEVNGWVRTKRESKNICFIEITDGSCLSSLQTVIDTDNINPKKISQELHTGVSVKIKGSLNESPGQNQSVELLASEIMIFGDADPEHYPLQKKRHSMEFLREIAHLRPRTNTFGAVARVSSYTAFAIHKYFQGKGFSWLRSPVITAIDAEGAGNMFQVTTLPVEEKKVEDYENDFFGKKAYLTVTGQLEAENYACALGNVYTFGPTFRAENSNTSRHLAEFWMVEPEMAFCDIDLNMDMAEDFLKSVLDDILSNCGEDMGFFDSWIQKGVADVLKQVIKKPFTRISYSTAIKDLEKADIDFDFKAGWGADLQSEHEKYLTENVYKGPVIVTDYPKEIKAFYMKMNDDGKTVRAMDVLVPRLGEIIGGSERENDLVKLEKRMNELEMKTEDYWWYLDLRRYGSVPHSGFGLGFERLIQYMTGMQNIRDVIPFPKTQKASCLLTNAPSETSKEQLEELYIKLRPAI